MACNLESFLKSWRAIGIESPVLNSVHGELLTRYAERQRYYHTLQHLEECFEKVPEILPLAERPAEVEIALWFHDAIYDPQASDNEERSGRWAKETAVSVNAAPDVGQRLCDLIMCTRHEAVPKGADAQVLVDADLSILGADSGRFAEYEKQIRQEYSWVPEMIYVRKRVAVLRDFLGRQFIYSTRPFRDRYEIQARQNLAGSLTRLMDS